MSIQFAIERQFDAIKSKCIHKVIYDATLSVESHSANWRRKQTKFSLELNNWCNRMASKLENDDLLTCPICFEQFASPKTLPCLHNFCLKSYITSHVSGKEQKTGQFPCPVCRQEVQISDSGLSSEQIVDKMPSNHFITALIDRSLASEDGQREKLCGPCKNDNRKIPAVTWCTICLEGMCQNCTSCHKWMKLSRSHTTLPISEVPEESLAMPLLEVDEPCLKHAGKVLEVYCLGHKEMCCVLCLATNHRECKHISTLEEMVSGSESLESVKDFGGYLTQVQQSTEQVRVKTENNIKSLDKRQSEISKKVSDVVQKAKDKLDQLKSDFLTNLQQKHKEQRTKLTERKERVEIFQSCVKKAETLLDAVSKQGTAKHLFVTKEKMKIQLQNQMESLTDHLQDVDEVDYKLKLDSAVLTVSESLTSVADLEITNKAGDLHVDVREIQVTLDRLCNKEPKTVDLQKIKATKVCNIGSGHYGGGTFLPDGRLVFCSVSQQALQACRTDGTQLFEIPLNDSPRDACVVSPCEIIVSFLIAKSLKRFEVKQDKFELKNSFRCKNYPEGLEASKDFILVGSTATVDMFTLDGNCIRTITQLSSDVVSKHSCTYVAYSMPGIVCFGDRNGVVSVSLYGRELSRLNSPEIKNVFGVAVDKYGCIYACGLDSSNKLLKRNRYRKYYL
ncbi:LOW QUALITY PROTEIN: hypothetical protein KUTeg_000832 [Tegillarca granosa]|uniref:Uncharacterized protein n=1 Tax=Tegillarca granosa TaxID=220873 RepID=A0ABQ9G1T7_TEGGR|nr:LOW QUALITY PROTEIN: hypothetical protein KUTeg_000832 [Tegillarca granosa]